MKTYINYWGHKLQFPKEIAYYSPEWMWVKVESDGRLRIGISDLGVRAVKYLDYIRLKARLGKEIKKGELMGMVDTSKMVWEIIAPVSGKVVEMNPDIANGSPRYVIDDNYVEGWIFLLEKVASTDNELKTLHKSGDPKTEQWLEETILKNVPLEEGSK